MNRPEEALQKACVEILARFCPPPKEFGPLWWATPNQRGTRKKWEMGILKSLGVRRGVPDLLVLWRGRLIGVELKAGKNDMTQAQLEFAEDMHSAGGKVHVVRSVDGFLSLLSGIGIPCRVKVAGQVA